MPIYNIDILKNLICLTPDPANPIHSTANTNTSVPGK